MYKFMIHTSVPLVAATFRLDKAYISYFVYHNVSSILNFYVNMPRCIILSYNLFNDLFRE